LRVGARLYAVDDRRTHEGYPLSAGLQKPGSFSVGEAMEMLMKGKGSQLTWSPSPHRDAARPTVCTH